MTKTPRRVLLVDNDKDVLASVRYSLKVEGYDVLTATNAKTAVELMAREIFHLAIIDIRLEDEKHKRDITGFEVAKELPPYIPCVIYTAYEDRENIRQAFGKVGAKDIVDKTKPDSPAKLIEIVNNLFASDIKVNFNLEIDSSINLDKKVTRIEIPDSEREFQPSADDLRQLFQTLFHNAVGIHIDPLLSPEPAPTLTQAGSVLMLARPRFEDAWGAPVVIKLSDQAEIKQEAGNYRLLKPFLGGQRLAVLEQEAYSRRLGGLVYSLLGAEDWGAIRTFGDVFLNEDTATVIGLLERFFSQTFETLFADAHRETIDLTQTYTEALGLTPQKLRVALEKFHPEAIKEPGLSFKGLQDLFINPFVWAVSEDKFRRFETQIRMCLCHGDLHSRNILVDSGGYFWLIDFARAAKSHALRDFAELETDIKFNLLAVVDLRSLLPFEQALLASTNFAETPPDTIFADKQLDHAYQVVQALRRIASDLIDLDGNMQEYYEALFLHTLNIIRLRHINVTQKEHALLSASLICERLDNWASSGTAKPKHQSRG